MQHWADRFTRNSLRASTHCARSINAVAPVSRSHRISEGKTMTHKGYNKLLREAASERSQWYGIDTVMARKTQCQWLRRLRREFPFSQFGITWGVNL